MKNLKSTARRASVLLAALTTALPALTLAAPPTTLRASTSGAGLEGNHNSSEISISANGLMVAFESYANNLVKGDGNRGADVFVRNLSNGQIKRITKNSIEPSGETGFNSTPVLSGTGRFVAFSSIAKDLAAGDRNGTYDIFVYDLANGSAKRASLNNTGVEGNGQSLDPSISADGKRVAFESVATNLVPDDSNNANDVFVRDLALRKTKRVSTGVNGIESNGDSSNVSLSAEGRFAAFESDASNLIENDLNNSTDVFVRDLQTGMTERVSVDDSGLEARGPSFEPSISADGRYVAFWSSAPNLVAGDFNRTSDVFIHDRQTGITKRVSIDSLGGEANRTSYNPSISADGRFIAFASWADNLVADDFNGVYDIFVHDQTTGVTERINIADDLSEGNDISFRPSISATGNAVTFSSNASNLVTGDTNNVTDVFVHLR